MRRIESQREQWPHRVADQAQSGSSTVFTDSTGNGALDAFAAGSAIGTGYGRADTATNVAQDAAGNRYEFGGSGPGSTNVDKNKPAKSWDCSGISGDLYNSMTGRSPDGQYTTDASGARMNTTSDFGAMGFERGYQPGSFNIGVNPNPGAGGHMVSELPNGAHVESSGRDGVEYGPGARSVNDPMFSQQWHLPDSGSFSSNRAQSTWDATTKTSQRRQAVPEHPSRQYLDKLMKHIEDNGWAGMTVKKVPGDAPKSGYMVSIKGTENKIPLDDLSGQALQEFMHKWHPLINAHPEHFMGGWQEGREWYNDVSRRHDHAKGLGPAARDAFQNDQLALYDLDNDKVIGTDEAGWMTGAPWKVGHHERTGR